MNYDPLKEPNPKEWLEIDEQERIDSISEYHIKNNIKLPNLKVHAVLHTVVENQIALGDETPVKKTVARLVSEGLDRHDVLHVVAQVLISHMNNMAGDGSSATNEDYYRELEALSVKACLES